MIFAICFLEQTSLLQRHVERCEIIRTDCAIVRECVLIVLGRPSFNIEVDRGGNSTDRYDVRSSRYSYPGQSRRLLKDNARKNRSARSVCCVSSERAVYPQSKRDPE